MFDDYSISVIIPVFNGENYIKSAIDSVISQTYKNVEIIVIDDGSVDQTEAVVRGYGNKVRYIKKENGGVASALNIGLKEMKGRYFSWLSHDDFFYPKKLEKQIKVVMKNPDKSRFVYSNFDLLDVNCNKIIKEKSAKIRYGNYCEIGTFPVLFNLINGCTVLIDREVFNEVGGFKEDLITSQDYDMWFRILRKYNPVYIDERLVCNRLHDAQGSRMIESYADNCQDIQSVMLSSLKDEEIHLTFGGKYKFLSDMLELSMDYKWRNCVKYLKDRLIVEEEPIIDNSMYRLYLYGAGKKGEKLLKYCFRRGINVIGFIDRDKNKQGSKIFDVTCFSIENVPIDSEIWITIYDDEGIKNELISKGYNVKEYTETLNAIFSTLPIKQKLLYTAEQYLKNGEGLD